MGQMSELDIRFKELEERVSNLESVVKSYGVLFNDISKMNKNQMEINEKMLGSINKIIKTITLE